MGCCPTRITQIDFSPNLIQNNYEISKSNFNSNLSYFHNGNSEFKKSKKRDSYSTSHHYINKEIRRNKIICTPKKSYSPKSGYQTFWNDGEVVEKNINRQFGFSIYNPKSGSPKKNAKLVNSKTPNYASAEKIYKKIDIDKNYRLKRETIKKLNILTESFIEKSKHNTEKSFKDVDHQNKSSIHRKKRDTTVHIQAMTNEEGNLQINNYLLMDNLGSGAFASVRLAFDLVNDKYFAVKIIDKLKLKRAFFKPGKQSFNLIENEKAILRRIDNVNCVETYEILEDQQFCYFVFEYMSGGSLTDISPTLTMNQIWRYYRDIIIGLEYLHETAKIIHFDIKTENLLLNEYGKLKISDFGISKIIENDDDLIVSYKYSSPFYTAPEMTVSNNSFRGKAVDIWATGVVLYYLIYKKLPFYVKSSHEILVLNDLIRNKQLEFDENIAIDENLKDLLTRLLEKNPDKRIKLNEIKIHPWITNNGNVQLIRNSRINKSKEITVSPVVFRATVNTSVQLKGITFEKDMNKEY